MSNIFGMSKGSETSLVENVFQCPITPAKQTNADRIRAMSDEELAEFLDAACENSCFTICNNYDWCKRNNAPEPVCKRHYLGWLKQEEHHEH